MKKIVLFILLLMPINIFALNTEINSKSAIIVNRENNEILYKKNIDEELKIASLTKIMTTILAIENIDDINELVTITESDINITPDYVTLGLNVGDSISYEDLLYSTMLKSAADSAITLSNHVFNDYNIFIDNMNSLAKKLDMNNTKFSNPVGKDEDNYSTSNDLYKLLDYALKNNLFKKIYSTNSYTLKYNDKNISNYVNNTIEKKLEIKDINFIGTKTGFTTLSGQSLSGISNINNNEILIITIGAMGNQDEILHIKDSVNLLNEIKKNYSNRILVEKNYLVDNIKYQQTGNTFDYEIKMPKTITRFMDNRDDLKYLKIYYDGKTTLNKKIKHNEKIGKIKIFYKDELLEEVDVKFNKANMIIELKDFKNIFIIGLICIGILIVLRKKH